MIDSKFVQKRKPISINNKLFSSTASLLLTSTLLTAEIIDVS